MDTITKLRDQVRRLKKELSATAAKPVCCGQPRGRTQDGKPICCTHPDVEYSEIVTTLLDEAIV